MVLFLFFLCFADEDPDEVEDFVVSDTENDAFLRLLDQKSWLKDFWIYPEENLEGNTIENIVGRNRKS